MADQREAIMTRLEAVLGKVSGVDEVLRDAIIPDDEDADRKCRIILLEGDEISDEEDPVARPANAPRRIHMQPQILLLNYAASADIGPSLSRLRAAVIKAIDGDTALTALTLNNRGGRYLGMESDLGYARAMAGELALKFQFTYVLRPDQL